jgi:hypothetical protein
MDADALRELVALYDRPVEGSRLAVLDAMREHGGEEAALSLAGSADAEERWLAARLMHLLRDARYAAALEPLVEDSDAETARAARNAFGAQMRTDEWEAIAQRLTRARDPELTVRARAWLAGEP